MYKTYRIIRVHPNKAKNAVPAIRNLKTPKRCSGYSLPVTLARYIDS